MRVLFLAYGATRTRTVVAESARVVAAGGRAVVLVEWPRLWRGVEFAPGVEVVPVHGDRWAGALVDLALFRLPESLVRLLARGPLARTVARYGRAYHHRVARPLLEEVVLPAYRRLARSARERVLRGQLSGAARPDLVVIADPASMPEGRSVLARFPDGDGPRLAYRADLPSGD